MMHNISKPLDPNMANSELARASHPRIFNVQVNDDLSVNLLPFLLMLKLAFFLGLILKDALVGTLKDWLRGKRFEDDWAYYSPESYYGSDVWTNKRENPGGSPDTTNEFRYVDANKITANEGPSFFESGKSILGLASQAGSDAIDWLLGSIDYEDDESYPIVKSLPYSSYAGVEEEEEGTDEVFYHGAGSRGDSGGDGSLPPLDPGQYLSPAPAPAHYITKSDSGGRRDQPSLSYDPDTKTLYIDRDSADLLSLRDGDTVPVPNDILSEAIGQGQIALLGEAPPSLLHHSQTSGATYAPVRDLLGGVVRGRNQGRFPSYLSPAPVVYPPLHQEETPASPVSHHTYYHHHHRPRAAFKSSFKEESATPPPQWTPVNTPSSNPLYY